MYINIYIDTDNNISINTKYTECANKNNFLGEKSILAKVARISAKLLGFIHKYLHNIYC